MYLIVEEDPAFTSSMYRHFIMGLGPALTSSMHFIMEKDPAFASSMYLIMEEDPTLT